MAKPIQTPESFTDFLFPVNGLDLSQTFDQQRLGTTPTGQNVRAFDVLRFRARGGSRPGLIRYPDDLVPLDATAAKEIQHLGVVVDPTTQATLDDQDGNDTNDDSSDDADFIDDPSTNNHSTRIPTGRRVRRHGSGRSPGRNKNANLDWVAASSATDTGTGSPMVTNWTGTPLTGAIAIVVVGGFKTAAYGAGVADISFGVTDNQGNTWHQVDSLGSVESLLTGGGAHFQDAAINLAVFWTITRAATALVTTVTPTGSASFTTNMVGSSYAMMYSSGAVTACNAAQPVATASATGTASNGQTFGVDCTLSGSKDLLVLGINTVCGASGPGGQTNSGLGVASAAITLNAVGTERFTIPASPPSIGLGVPGTDNGQYVVIAVSFRPVPSASPAKAPGGVGRLTPGNGINALGGGGGTGKVSFGKISGS